MAGLSAVSLPVFAPAIARAADRPAITDGVMSGEVTGNSCVVWARADRPAKMLVDWSTTESFANAQPVLGAEALNRRDFTASAELTGLPADQTIFYRVRFEGDSGAGEPIIGRLRTPGPKRKVTSFVFGGDQVGGGWGINPEWGGLRIYDAMARTEPDFLVHLGDRIYSDNVLRESVALEDGTVWRNVVTPAKSHFAQTLDDFRGNYRYNLLDEHVRHFNAAVPQHVTWDDHEIVDNWWPGKKISDGRGKRRRYADDDTAGLFRHAHQAFVEYTPLDPAAMKSGLLWRAHAYGPAVEVFLLDQRSHRSANRIAGRQDMDDASELMGRAQTEWLKGALARSTALWKIVASPLPLAHIGRAYRQGEYDKFSDAKDELPHGREREAAEILSWIKAHGIRNVAWIAADVHYAAANEFHPDRAIFKEFAPFWEFIAGPFHTQAFPPERLDKTFGPRNHYISTKGVKGNPPPSAGWCNFGHIAIDHASGALTIGFRDVNGKTMWSKVIEAER